MAIVADATLGELCGALRAAVLVLPAIHVQLTYDAVLAELEHWVGSPSAPLFAQWPVFFLCALETAGMSTPGPFTCRVLRCLRRWTDRALAGERSAARAEGPGSTGVARAVRVMRFAFGLVGSLSMPSELAMQLLECAADTATTLSLTTVDEPTPATAARSRGTAAQLASSGACLMARCGGALFGPGASPAAAAVARALLFDWVPMLLEHASAVRARDCLHGMRLIVLSCVVYRPRQVHVSVLEEFVAACTHWGAARERLPELLAALHRAQTAQSADEPGFPQAWEPFACYPPLPGRGVRAWRCLARREPTPAHRVRPAHSDCTACLLAQFHASSPGKEPLGLGLGLGLLPPPTTSPRPRKRVWTAISRSTADGCAAAQHSSALGQGQRQGQRQQHALGQQRSTEAQQSAAHGPDSPCKRARLNHACVAGTPSAPGAPSVDWSRLPDDVLVSVLGFASARSLAKLQAVSRQWRAAAQSRWLWGLLFWRRWRKRVQCRHNAGAGSGVCRAAGRSVFLPAALAAAHRHDWRVLYAARHSAEMALRRATPARGRRLAALSGGAGRRVATAMCLRCDCAFVAANAAQLLVRAVPRSCWRRSPARSQRHTRKHEAQDTVRCPAAGCGFIAPAASELRQHCQAVHADQPPLYVCECGRAYRSRTGAQPRSRSFARMHLMHQWLRRLLQAWRNTLRSGMPGTRCALCCALPMREHEG